MKTRCLISAGILVLFVAGPAAAQATPAEVAAFDGMSSAMSTTTPIASMKAANAQPASRLARAWLTGSLLAMRLGTRGLGALFFGRAGPPRRTCAALTSRLPQSAARPARHS